MRTILFSLVLLMGCKDEKAIRAKFWNGGNNEIVRDINGNQEEFLLTNDPKFLDFVCIEKRDAEALVREALRRCD